MLTRDGLWCGVAIASGPVSIVVIVGRLEQNVLFGTKHTV